MKYIFITNKSPYYPQAVTLRASLFFNGMKNVDSLINDNFEADGQHLICLDEVTDTVIGTGRLNLKNEVGIISQMAISETFQQTGIGKTILNHLIEKCEELSLKKITLSARKTAIPFYEKFEFVGLGELYPSKKTSVLHQNMNRHL